MPANFYQNHYKIHSAAL